jgi:hypothetical protein
MARTATRDELTGTAADAAIDLAGRILRLPTIRGRHGEIAAAATRQQMPVPPPVTRATLPSSFPDMIFPLYARVPELVDMLPQ